MASRDDLPLTLALARRLKAEGFELLLDLHLSDSWADPDNQRPPRAWHGLEHDTPADSLRLYVKDLLGTFAAADCLPGIVQIGNEIDNGLLWPVPPMSNIACASAVCWTSAGSTSTCSA